MHSVYCPPLNIILNPRADLEDHIADVAIKRFPNSPRCRVNKLRLTLLRHPSLDGFGALRDLAKVSLGSCDGEGQDAFVDFVLNVAFDLLSVMLESASDPSSPQQNPSRGRVNRARNPFLRALGLVRLHIRVRRSAGGSPRAGGKHPLSPSLPDAVKLAGASADVGALIQRAVADVSSKQTDC
jgi:hypothetical protein